MKALRTDLFILLVNRSILKIEYLNWDSTFFNKRIGKASWQDEFKFDKDELGQYDLVYFFADPDKVRLNEAIKGLGALLVDEKVVFVKNTGPGTDHGEVIAYRRSNGKKDDDVIRIGLQSGIYSRFATDKNFGEGIFTRFYTEWMNKSIDRKMAEEVFVVEVQDAIKGVITLGRKSNRGDIGILAVDEKYRGQNIGFRLVQKCEAYCTNKGIDKLQVTAQAANKAACSFYTKYGFSIESITNVYHLWPGKMK